MKNFIEVFDNALSKEQCKSIIDYMNNDCVLKPGVMPVSRVPKINDVWKERKDDWEKLMNITDDDENNNIIRFNLIKCIDKYIDINDFKNKINQYLNN